MRRRRSAAPTTAPTTRSARPTRASTAEFLVERVHCTGLRVFRCVFSPDRILISLFPKISEIL